VIFPFICSNIPAAPAYWEYISQLIWYSRPCGSYQDFLDRGLLLTRKTLNQRVPIGYVEVFTSNVYGFHHDFINRYGICVTTDHGYVPLVSNARSFLHSRFFIIITGVVIRVTRRVPLVEQGLITLQEHTSPLPVFSAVHVARSLIFCVMFCRSLFVYHLKES